MTNRTELAVWALQHQQSIRAIGPQRVDECVA
jgi:hypothetical protein